MRPFGLGLALAMIGAQALAQTGSSGPSSTATAKANAEVAAGVNKASNVPTAPGANIMITPPAQPENCALPISAGWGSLFAGLTFVWSHTDEGCETRRDAAALGAYASRQAAVQRLCQRKGNRLAMKAAGTPCADQH
jgi:hypothetical protein